MKNIILNTWIIVLLIMLVGGLSFYYAINSQEFLWVSRSGSIITVLGILLTIKHKIFNDSSFIHSLISEIIKSPTRTPYQGSDIYHHQLKHTKYRMRDEYLGFAITIAGTVIWGYGDLLGVFYL